MNRLSDKELEAEQQDHSAQEQRRIHAPTHATQLPPPVLPLPPLSTRVGRYQIKRLIASGGMGVIARSR